MRRWRTAACAALALALTPAGALAAECPRTTLAEVEKQVMCPVCGVPLGLATEAPQALRERELIRELVADCRSEEEIKARLVAEFGDEVLALPGDDGIDLAAYLVPAIAVLAFGGALAVAVMQWRRTRGGRASPGPDAAAGPGGAAAERLQADLEKYDV